MKLLIWCVHFLISIYFLIGMNSLMALARMVTGKATIVPLGTEACELHQCFNFLGHWGSTL